MIKKLSLLLLAAMPAICPLSALAAQPLSATMKGRILIQVEAKGEAWYVDPVTEKRVYLGRPNDAFAVMRSYGLGISNKDLAKIGTAKEVSKDAALAKKLAGRILLQVEAKGEAWYINPLDFKKYYLGRPADAFALMRSKGLGISNTNLEKISPVSTTTTKPTETVTQPTESQKPNDNLATSTNNTETVASSSQATSSPIIKAEEETVSTENLSWGVATKIASSRNNSQIYYSSNGDLWMFYSDNYNNLYSRVRKNNNVFFDREILISSNAKKASPWFDAQGEIKKLAVSTDGQTLIMETSDNGASWSTKKSYSNQDAACSSNYPEARIAGDNGELLVFGYRSNSSTLGCHATIRSVMFKDGAWSDNPKNIGDGEVLLVSYKNQAITISGSNSIFSSSDNGETYTEIKGGDTATDRFDAQSAFKVGSKIFLGRSYSYGPENQSNKHLAIVAGEGAFSNPQRTIIQSNDSYYKNFEITGSANIFMATWTIFGLSGRLKGSISYDSGKTWSQAFDIARTPTGYDFPFLETENISFKTASLHGRTAIAYTAQKGNAKDVYLIEYK